jgi:hypothetical protein
METFYKKEILVNIKKVNFNVKRIDKMWETNLDILNNKNEEKVKQFK